MIPDTLALEVRTQAVSAAGGHQAPTQHTRATANAARACLVWWCEEPARCPGKNAGSCPADLARSPQRSVPENQQRSVLDVWRCHLLIQWRRLISGVQARPGRT